MIAHFNLINTIIIEHHNFCEYFQASIRAQACWFNISCALKDVDFSTPEGENERDEMIKDVTNQNTEAIRSAKDSMNFENLESLEQGAGTLYAITV